MTNNVKKKAYWGVFFQKRVDFEGSFSDCWNWFVERYGDKTLHELEISGVRVGRLS